MTYAQTSYDISQPAQALNCFFISSFHIHIQASVLHVYLEQYYNEIMTSRIYIHQALSTKPLRYSLRFSELLLLLPPQDPLPCLLILTLNAQLVTENRFWISYSWLNPDRLGVNRA